jgi:drug/metabolite transporter (DMT)-like permease
MFARGLFVLIVALALWAWISTIARILRTREGGFRNASQVAWLFVVIVVPLIGVPLYWFMESAARDRHPDDRL